MPNLPDELSVEPAGHTLRDQALDMLYRGLPEAERNLQIAELQQATARGELSLDDLLVARRRNAVVGAVLAVRRAGGMACLWPPVAQSGPESRAVAAALLVRLNARLDAAGVAFTQCLCPPGDSRQLALLAAAGLSRITDMLLLSRKIEDDAGPSPSPSSTRQLPATDPPAELQCELYQPASHARFAAVIELSCNETLDCPVVVGLRSGDQMLAAHRQSGMFEPRLWSLWRIAGEDAGVLLASDQVDRSVREVLYLGVVPKYRRQGLARLMLYNAMDEAWIAGRGAVEVAVDAKNRYALPLYVASGFEEQQRLAVCLRIRPGHEQRRVLEESAR